MTSAIFLGPVEPVEFRKGTIMKRIFPAKTPFEHGYNAFINNEDRPYRTASFYEREWYRGWNIAFNKNKDRFVA